MQQRYFDEEQRIGENIERKYEMTAVRAVEILENEKACVIQVNTCGRNCAECDLVLPDTEIIEAYNMAIEELTVGHTIPSSYVSADRVLEIVDDALKLERKAIKATANQIQIVKQLRDRILKLKRGEHDYA